MQKIMSPSHLGKYQSPKTKEGGREGLDGALSERRRKEWGDAAEWPMGWDGIGRRRWQLIVGSDERNSAYAKNCQLGSEVYICTMCH